MWIVSVGSGVWSGVVEWGGAVTLRMVVLRIRRLCVILQIEMRRNLFRYIASIALLVSYLPMFVLSSLHVHHDTIDATDECGLCVGHIETAHHHQHDCQYCTFLGMSFLAERSELRTALFPSSEAVTAAVVERAQSGDAGVVSLRAPPMA